jgi:hypothetical protein
MKQCKVCAQELPDEKFGNTYHTLSDGTRKAYKDSTCMVCRRKKHLENPEKKEIHKRGASNWYKNNPDKAKEQRLRKYGITLQQYNQMRKDQNYCCAVCGRHEEEVEQGRAVSSSTSLCVDHCHTTDKIRGLLCTNCNTMIGKSKDDIFVLEAAITYLKETL